MNNSLASKCLFSLLLWMGMGCGSGTQDLDRLHGPVDVAYLPPGPFFEQPVGYVTNWRSGTISKLDLRRYDMLVEDGPAAWVVAPPLATGRTRVLDQIAVSTDGDTFVDLLVTDAFRDELLRVPHVRMGEDGVPSFATPQLSQEPVVSGAGNAQPRLLDLTLLTGAATTETWTLTFDGWSWKVEGSASGRQVGEVLPGVPYSSDADELRFTMDHGGQTPDLGATLVFAVDTGIEAVALEGYASDLLVTPDLSFVLVSEEGRDEGQGPSGKVAIYDPIRLERLFSIELPPGAKPAGMALRGTGTEVFIADLSDLNLVHRLDISSGDPASFVLTSLPVPAPTVDVACGHDPQSEILFAAEAFGTAIHAIDLATLSAVDINPWTPDVEPVEVGAPIAGITASDGTVELNTLTSWGANEHAYALLVTTFTGFLYVYDAATGCAAYESPQGAYLETGSDGTVSAFTDLTPPSNPVVEADAETGLYATTNDCGGVTRDQGWTFTYDEALLSYTVEGAASGVQVGRAYEGVRYTTDSGELSLLIRGGTLATTDGDRFSFSVNDGVSPIPTQELPGDPLVYTDEYGDKDDPWVKVRTRQAAVVPCTGNDAVMWVDVQGYGDGGIQYFQ